MQVGELVSWFDNLPYEARLYWTGSATLNYDNLPWRRYYEYTNKATKSFLTYEEAHTVAPSLSWDAYVKTPDYDLWVFNMRDALHRSYEQESDRLAEEHSHGLARSPAFVMEE